MKIKLPNWIFLNFPENAPKILNPPSIVKGNINKTYLLDLQRHGIPIPQTFVCQNGDELQDAISKIKGKIQNQSFFKTKYNETSL